MSPEYDTPPTVRMLDRSDFAFTTHSPVTRLTLDATIVFSTGTN